MQIKASKKSKRLMRLKPMADPDRRLLDRAEKLVRRLSSVFPPERFRSPSASIFEGWEQGANPNPSALLENTTYPSKTVQHPVLQSVLAGAIPLGGGPGGGYATAAPTAASHHGGWTSPAPVSVAIIPPNPASFGLGGGGGSGSLADLYGSGSGPAAPRNSHGRFTGGDDSPPLSAAELAALKRSKKKGSGSAARAKSASKGIPPYAPHP